MNDIRTSTLTSLAMLKVNNDLRNQDYVDYLVPFVIEVLRTHLPDTVIDSEVATYLKADFGLQIPCRGVQLVLTRLRKRKLLVRSHAITQIAAELPDTGILKRRVEASQRISVVLNKLINYAAEEFSQDWQPEKASEVITSYLSLFAIQCLKTYIYGTALPEVPRRQPRELHIVHAFVRDSYRQSIQDFEAFMVVVKGHMLANALLCPDLESLQRKFDKVTFYFDTPLILGLLDLGFPPANATTKDLLILLQSLRGTVAVFDDTIDETHRVLHGAESCYNRSDRQPAIVRAMREQGRTVSDLTLLRGQLADRLDALHVKRLHAPRHEPEYQIDESVLEQCLDDEIGYFNPRAKLHDINCIRSIFALRRGLHPMRLEDARAVFVTSNSDLARLAFEFGKKYEHSREISSVIADFSLANVAWLKAPLGAPELPAREVLAACYAALEPSHELWQKYLIEVERLEQSGQISARDHEFLRYELTAREELMDMTCGDPDAFSNVSVPEILERARKHYVDEEQKKVESLTKENRLLREKDDRRQARLYWLAERIGVWAQYLCGLLFVACAVLVSGLVPESWLDSTGTSRWVAAALGGLLICGTALGLLNVVRGLSVWDLLRHIQRRTRDFSYRALRRLVLNSLETDQEECHGAFEKKEV